jgi:hypothetical protein
MFSWTPTCQFYLLQHLLKPLRNLIFGRHLNKIILLLIRVLLYGTGTLPLMLFFWTHINCAKGKLCYRRSILELKPKNGEYGSSKSTFSLIFFHFFSKMYCIETSFHPCIIFQAKKKLQITLKIWIYNEERIPRYRRSACTYKIKQSWIFLKNSNK